METEEQRKAKQQLAAEFGPRLVAIAVELSGMKNAMHGCATQEETVEGRVGAMRVATQHATNLIGLLDPALDHVKLFECARRIDTYVDLWAADDQEDHS